jgi:3-phenylpropionate/trans-cinnamate dioxygenase ferredoxin subunit
MEPWMSKDGFERVAALDDLAEGVPVNVELSKEEQICLIKFQGEVYAIADSCSHADFPMSDGEMVDDYIIECGLHGAQFDIRDGSAVELPATDPITCYDVRVESNAVWVKPGGL